MIMNMLTVEGSQNDWDINPSLSSSKHIQIIIKMLVFDTSIQHSFYAHSGRKNGRIICKARIMVLHAKCYML